VRQRSYEFERAIHVLLAARSAWGSNDLLPGPSASVSGTSGGGRRRDHGRATAGSKPETRERVVCHRKGELVLPEHRQPDPRILKVCKLGLRP
jgi:hypothetical protein